MGVTASIDRLAVWFGGNRVLVRLLAANIGASLLLWIAALALKLAGADTGVLYTLAALPSGALALATHPWTLFTYMFAHFSPLHLLFNMLWLYWFGSMLSGVERDNTVLWLFIGGGMTGGFLYAISSILLGYAPGSYLAGASAAVLAVMCATALRMPHRRIGLFLIGEVKLKWVALACVALTLLGSGSGIPTQAAHLGGVVFGVVWFWTRRRVTPRSNPGRVKIDARAMARAMKNRVPDHVRLDQLLDKIRISGYDSLSAKEKTELDHLSARIK